MIKCEVVKEFTLKRFDELKNIIRKNPNKNQKGKLYVEDIFECDKEMADYLMGANKDGQVVVKVIEVEPEIKVLSQSPIEEFKEEVFKKDALEFIEKTKPKKKKHSKK